MSKETARNFFIVSSMPRLYQHLLTGRVGYEALGNRIIKQIKTAHAFRQVEQVRELARVLSNIPIKEYHLIGQYYLLWCSCRESIFKVEALESIIEQTQIYKAQALSSRAVIEAYQGRLETALYFYAEALRTSPAVSEYISAMLGIAAIKGLEGYHQSALKDMQNLIPLIRYAEPRLFFNALNSYATELGVVGRIYEARNISQTVLASPFAPAYPEWQETAQELKPADRSFVAINPLTGRNVLRFKPTERSEATKASVAKILTFMAKKDQTKSDEPKMTKAEKAKWLRLRILSDEFPEDVLDEMIKMVREEDEK